MLSRYGFSPQIEQTLCDIEVCEYPDSGKMLVVADKPDGHGLRKIFRAETTVDYYDREKN